MPSDADWVSAVGFAVEYAWAAGEAVIVPYLVYIGVPLSTAVMVFAVNPIVAVAVQPYVGRLCDDRRYSRGALISVFTVTSACGICTILFARDAFPAWALPAVCFVAFGVLDVSHDVLLIPSRAWISDLGARDDAMETYHTRYSSAQNVGRLVSQLLGCLPLAALAGSLGFHVGAIEVLMLWTLLGSALLVIVSSCVLANRVPPVHAAGTAGASDGAAAADWDVAQRLFAFHAAGWLGYCAVTFYWTAWVGLGAELWVFGVPFNGALVGLVVHSITACLVSELCMEPLNTRFGCENMYTAGLALNAASLFLAPRVGGWAAVLCLIPQGISYPIHLTNGQLLLLLALPPERAGLASTLTSTAIPTAQIACTIVACICGAVPWFNALSGVFHFCAIAVLCGAVLCMLTLPNLSARRGEQVQMLTRKLSSTLGHSFYSHASALEKSVGRGGMVKSPSATAFAMNSVTPPSYGAL
eukprot:TRINITY_DN32651_c0_g1_i1.p1 TRINITY_DN32651_c0_g1~~TRINITY_DN32651_c0_g1_i1.p1  ORF type:complete len:471 (+),score=112.48 TRINITY_DN32651_c0_g1_i1:114-1526(+)